MKNPVIVCLLVLSSNFCQGQLERKEELLNDFWKSNTTRDSLAYRYCEYPSFLFPSEIHQSFDRYLDSGKINKMLKFLKDTTRLLWDSSKVKGIKFIPDKEGDIITGFPCSLGYGLGNDTAVVRKYTIKTKVLNKYNNPEGVYEYAIPIYDDSGQYSIFAKAFFCCGADCVDMYFYLYKKTNGHWGLLAQDHKGSDININLLQHQH